MLHEFTCVHCNQNKRHEDSLTTGYATVSGNADGSRAWGRYPAGSKVCFDCCAILDKLDMAHFGKATFYLSRPAKGWQAPLGSSKSTGYRVANWPGTLSFDVTHISTGRHNIAGKRYDVWFTGPDGVLWHGTQYGNNTQICHCKRSKSRT
jgi:hypothetical protein